MKILRKKNKKKPEPKPATKPKPATTKQKKPQNDPETNKAIQKYIKSLDKSISPKHLEVVGEFLNNNYKMGKAYQKFYPNCTSHSAVCLGSRILKKFSISDLLSLCDLGFGKIVSDLKLLPPEKRVYYLMKFHKLDHVNIALEGQMQEITVIMPSRPISQEEIDLIKSSKINSPEDYKKAMQANEKKEQAKEKRAKEKEQ